MTEQKLDRRAFFARAAALGLAVTAPTVLAACGKKSKGGAPAAPAAAKADCSDLSALSEQDKKTRAGLKYVDVTTVSGKNCANCKLFAKKPPCNTCTLLKGPIAENGYCTAWQAA